MKDKNQLETAFMQRFNRLNATCPARLLEKALVAEMLCYEKIDLPKEQKNDSILIAYEERMLIPVKSGKSSAWEDKILSLCPDEKYFIPLVVQCFIEEAMETGKFDAQSAVKHTLIQHSKDCVDELVQIFIMVRHHSASYTFEVGLLGAIMNKIDCIPDLHDVVDLFVILGIISPCTRGPMTTGLCWYEINPCLYWNLKDNTFERI